MSMSASKIKLGDEILFKVGERRGRPTAGYVIEKSRDEVTVLRPYRRELVKIQPEDIVSLAHEAEYTVPAKIAGEVRKPRNRKSD